MAKRSLTLIYGWQCLLGHGQPILPLTVMESKRHKRKLQKSASHDAASSCATQPDDATCGEDGASQTDSSPATLKREGFICSASHNAHLDEDYLTDKSALFGRLLPPVAVSEQRTSSPSKSRSRPASASPNLMKQVSSEKSLRRFFRTASVDTQSLRSGKQRRSGRRGSLLPVSEETGALQQQQHLNLSTPTPDPAATTSETASAQHQQQDHQEPPSSRLILHEQQNDLSPSNSVLRHFQAIGSPSLHQRRQKTLRKSYSEDSHSVVGSVSARRNAHAHLDQLGCAVPDAFALAQPEVPAEVVACDESGQHQNDQSRRTSLDVNDQLAATRLKRFGGRRPRLARGASEDRVKSPDRLERGQRKRPELDERSRVVTGVDAGHMVAQLEEDVGLGGWTSGQLMDGYRVKPVRHSRQVSLVSRTSGQDAVTLIEFNRLVRRETITRQEPFDGHARIPSSTSAPVLYKRYSLTHPMQSAMPDVDNTQEQQQPEHEELEQQSTHKAQRSGCKLPSALKRHSLIHPAGGSRPPMQQLGFEQELYKPICEDGRFRCPWTTWIKPSMWEGLKYALTAKDNSCIPNAQGLDKTLPIIPLNEDTLKNVPRQGMRVTWLGHSTVLVQFDKLTIVTDPMFSERASPLGFVGPKRYRAMPGTIYDLPRIDAVLISHNHYDHLDYNSVMLLNARFGADLQWFVPLGLERWMQSCGCQSVTEMSWWEESVIPHTPNTTFVFTPAQHWCKRSAKDDNTVLWGSFCVLSPRYRFFFAGDTGYCDAFKQIGNRYGPFDMAAIPIGAYEPRWFMQTQHVDPVEAVKIHQDLRASRSLGIHWGTFKLTNEHYLEPAQKMEESAKESGLQPNEFFVMKHGESRLMFA